MTALIELPTHPRTGLTALAVLASGRIVWPVLGASEDGGQEGEQDDQGEGGQDQDDAGQQDGEGEDKPLGPAGQKALEAEKDKRRKAAADLRAAREEIAQLKAGGDEAAKERLEIERTVRSNASAQIVSAKIEALAARDFVDPPAVLKFLDLKDFEVGEDYKVDEGAIKDALKQLLKDKPYLAAQGGRRFEGTGDGGARQPAPKARPATIREAYARKRN